MTERLHFHFSLSYIGEGNGNPLQCSCLENPRDWGAWWAAIYGVAQSRTWRKQLSSSSSILFSIVGSTNLHSHQQGRRGHLFTPYPSFIVCRLFDDGHSDWCELIPHCSFDLYFSNNEQCWAFFHVFIGYIYIYIFFGEMFVIVVVAFYLVFLIKYFD